MKTLNNKYHNNMYKFLIRYYHSCLDYSRSIPFFCCLYFLFLQVCKYGNIPIICVNFKANKLNTFLGTLVNA